METILMHTGHNPRFFGIEVSNGRSHHRHVHGPWTPEYSVFNWWMSSLEGPVQDKPHGVRTPSGVDLYVLETGTFI